MEVEDAADKHESKDWSPGEQGQLGGGRIRDDPKDLVAKLPEFAVNNPRNLLGASSDQAALGQPQNAIDTEYCYSVMASAVVSGLKLISCILQIANERSG